MEAKFVFVNKAIPSKSEATDGAATLGSNQESQSEATDKG